MENTISFDPNDYTGMLELMDKYGDSPSMYPGTNENGEDIFLSICPDSITVRTFQHNGWERVNTYSRDGDCDEIFVGRWREAGVCPAQ